MSRRYTKGGYKRSHKTFTWYNGFHTRRGRNGRTWIRSSLRDRGNGSAKRTFDKAKKLYQVSDMLQAGEKPNASYQTRKIANRLWKIANAKVKYAKRGNYRKYKKPIFKHFNVYGSEFMKVINPNPKLDAELTTKERWIFSRKESDGSYIYERDGS